MTYAAQKYMLTQTYVVASTTSVVSAYTELAALAVTLKDTTTAGTPGKELIDILPGNVDLDAVEVQQVFPIRSVYVKELIGVAGTAANASTGNIAGIVTLRTAFAGRNQIANKHVGPLPDSEFANGVLSGAQIIGLAALGTALLSSVGILTSTVLFDPCIYHRGSSTFSTVTNRIVSDRVGTMRRRTVRVGE